MINTDDLIMEDLERKYERAVSRVKELKDFYRHLKIFVLVNGVLYLMRSGVLLSLLPDGFPTQSYYFDWIHVNLIIWLVILGIHALYLFRHKITFLREWEERQIQKILEKEEDEIDKYL